jgi:hypothetical protein
MAGRLLAAVFVVLSSPFAAHAAAPTEREWPAWPRELTLSMASDCGPSHRVLALARAEAVRVWAPSGVVIRWVAPAELPFAAPREGWLVVRCDPDRSPLRPGTAGLAETIASIRFIGGDPTNTIMLRVASASALLARDTPAARALDERFPPLREERLARVLGRAIAHEVGHFLARSGDHTRRGLMKSSHSVELFAGQSLEPFRVDLVPTMARLSPLEESLER